MAEDQEKSELGDIDDWLADLEGEEAGGEESGQAAAEEPAGDLEQDDIDQMLAGDQSSGQDDAGDEDSAELDQSDIDSLFNDAPQAAAAPPAGGGEQEAGDDSSNDSVELDQAELDKLLSGGDEAPAPAEEDVGQQAAGQASGGEEPPAEQPPQDLKDDFGDLDPLSEGDEQSEQAASGGTEEQSPAAAAGGAQDDFDFGDDFDIDGFDFDDSIPDIPDEEALSAVAEAGDQQPAAPKANGEAEDIFADAEGEGAAEAGKGRLPLLAALPGLLPSLPAPVNRSTVGAALLSLLVLIGGYYFFMGGDSEPEPAIPPQVQQEMVEALEPEPATPESPPTARDDRYRMAEAGQAVSMRLAGEAADGGPVVFEIVTPPSYGRLSGEPPEVTYLPNRDFPGRDSFTYRVSDGRRTSAEATVEIVAADDVMMAEEEEEGEAAEEVAEVVRLTPARPLVRARDLTLRTRSTETLPIDWAEIWRRDNPGKPFARARVEILERQLTGQLEQERDGAVYRYRPDPYFQGTESLRYRFHYAGIKSKPRRLTLRVELGDPPPDIRLRPLAANYPVGETVIVDARETKAARPEQLRFHWQQLSGTEVRLEPLAANDAAVRFVAPSSFNTVSPKVVLQVTAVDPAGQRDSRIIEIHTQSRRSGALRSATSGEEGRRSPLRGF
ncbi:MAG: Ig-like domain-containing protein [Desulfurivibrio sp.]|nr:Ig-like domain-containing protein [Desulfurivibrio sp.]